MKMKKTIVIISFNFVEKMFWHRITVSNEFMHDVNETRRIVSKEKFGWKNGETIEAQTHKFRPTWKSL